MCEDILMDDTEVALHRGGRAGGEGRWGRQG